MLLISKYGENVKQVDFTNQATFNFGAESLKHCIRGSVCADR